MSIPDYLSSLVVILACMAALAAVEAFAPLFVAGGLPSGRRAANLAMTAQTFATNFLLGSLAAVPALAGPGAAESGGSGWTAALRLVGSIVALDFAFGYVAHRTMHASPWLWRVHRVHHSDSFVDVTTTYRTHPVESAWRYLWMGATAWALAVPAGTLLAYRLLSALNGLLEHANIRVEPRLDAAVSRWWVTPNMHKVHHSRDAAETDTNYGNLLSLYDRLLGTFTPSERALTVAYGLDETAANPPATLGELLAMPFTSPPPRGVAAKA